MSRPCPLHCVKRHALLGRPNHAEPLPPIGHSRRLIEGALVRPNPGSFFAIRPPPLQASTPPLHRQLPLSLDPPRVAHLLVLGRGRLGLRATWRPRRPDRARICRHAAAARWSPAHEQLRPLYHLDAVLAGHAASDALNQRLPANGPTRDGDGSMARRTADQGLDARWNFAAAQSDPDRIHRPGPVLGQPANRPWTEHPDRGPGQRCASERRYVARTARRAGHEWDSGPSANGGGRGMG